MQAITPGKCTSALRHYANIYYKEKKNTSTDRLRGTTKGSTLFFFFSMLFYSKNLIFFEKVIRDMI